MKLRYTSNLPRWPLAAGVLLTLLLVAHSVRAQQYHTGTAYNTGSLYQSSAFTNVAGASYRNTSSGSVYYAGPSAGTLTNAGVYTSSLGATDQFIGPGGAAGAQTLAGTVAPTFYNLTLANGSNSAFLVSNAAGADVAGLLTFSNGITTTTNAVAGALRLTGTGTQAATLAGTFSTSCYVDGYVAKAGTNAFTYPLGATNPANNTGNTTAANAAIYSPISLSNPGGTTLRYTAGGTPSPTAFATQSAALQLITVSSREYYPVSVGTVPTNTTITIPYGNFGPTPGGTAYVADPTLLTIAAYNGTNWTNLSATVTNDVNTTAKTVTVTLPAALATAYTALALASTRTAPLPVTLVAFAATKKGADGQLTWRTASELNSAYFELQASTNGTTWQVLTQVPAAGTSATAHDYGYSDKGLARYGVPLIYYRLRQVDLNGLAYYSPVVTLRPDAAAWNVAAYPNPYQANLMAQLTTSESGPVTVTLLDAVGSVILRREVMGNPGSQIIALDEARTVATGAYTLLVRQNAHSGTVRIVRE